MNQQIQTERGLIYVDAIFLSADIAEKAGYHYTFTSKKYGDLYSRITSDDGLRRAFALIKNTAWVNLGDVNFVQHGGTLVRRAFPDDSAKNASSLRTIYDVLYASPVDDLDGKMFASLTQVDLDDYPQISEEDPFIKAADIVNYYGSIQLNGQPYSVIQESPYLISREELAEWLKVLDADMFIGEF